LSEVVPAGSAGVFKGAADDAFYGFVHGGMRAPLVEKEKPRRRMATAGLSRQTDARSTTELHPPMVRATGLEPAT
jgi:hypothetical protein